MATMINLISRNGTLFSIIDGKEIVCKDQIFAKEAILFNVAETFPLDIKEGVIYSVPGYTVTENWGPFHEDVSPVAIISKEETDPLKEIKNVISEIDSVLSLEAPEKGIPKEIDEALNSITPSEFVAASEKYFGRRAEQPAQPVDEIIIIETNKWTGSKRVYPIIYTSIDDANKCKQKISSINNTIEIRSISPSPERGESDRMPDPELWSFVCDQIDTFHKLK